MTREWVVHDGVVLKHLNCIASLKSVRKVPYSYPPVKSKDDCLSSVFRNSYSRHAPRLPLYIIYGNRIRRSTYRANDGLSLGAPPKGIKSATRCIKYISKKPQLIPLHFNFRNETPALPKTEESKTPTSFNKYRY
jgi:hypothetical protein